MKDKNHKIIIDSGSTADMFGEEKFFSNLHLYDDSNKHDRIVILGDGSTSIFVDGIGTVDFQLNGKRIIKNNVLFVKKLADPLLSLKSHIKFSGCEMWSDSVQVFLQFPKGNLMANIEDEITMEIKPTVLSEIPIFCDFTKLERKQMSTVSRNKDWIPNSLQIKKTF